MMMRGTEQFVVVDNNNNNNIKAAAAAAAAEEGDKEKKKKRRPNRRPNKHNSPSNNNHTNSNSVPVCNAVNGVHGEASGRLGNGNALNCVTVLTNTYSSQNGVIGHISNDQGSESASDVAFSSLPTMRINDSVAEFRSTQDEPQLLPSVTSKSCPDPIFQQEANVLFPNTQSLPAHKNEFNAENQRKCFVPHWSDQTVLEAIEKGDVFRASFRVNAHNRLEAYCTVDGIPVDILISGIATQNRAVEGDTVAIKLDPLALWTRLKGSTCNVNTSAPTDDHKMLHKVVEVDGKNCKGKEKLDPDIEGMCSKDGTTHEIWGLYQDRTLTGVHPELGFGYGNYKHGSEECHSSSPQTPPNVGYAYSTENERLSSAIEKVCAMISSYPLKRPTGRVVAIIDRSPRRDSIVGFLAVKQWLSCRLGYKRETKKSNSSISLSDREYIQLTPNDAKFPKMLVAVRSLPDSIKRGLDKGDGTVEKELVAARIEEWRDDNILPQAQVMNTLGRGGEIGSQIAAILFEHAICFTEFSPKSISCLPELPWDVPVEEVERRKDLRNLCTFTIDPSTATDLDDALSVQKVSDAIFRVGVHIADASYFVLPDSPLDIEAQIRSTSVYLRQQKLPMLPSVLSENLGSLNPGADRLAFSIICDINPAGIVIDRWIGRTVIRSCCKLSYQHAQDIIDGLMDVENQSTFSSGCPKSHNQFEWKHIAESVKSLYVVSKRLRENRFKDGALSLGSSKLDFSFDECGIPLGSMFYEQKDSNSLVEEFMLLANRTVAEVISRAFPDSALLRRHPEPNLRKLREFEAFCQRHGLELDTSSSGQLHLSLMKLKEKLKNDPVLYDILISYASKPMQLAAYFCTGDFKDKRSDWAHYSLAVPFYTHFTSPLRRYPDIVVHRTLAAAIEAEDAYLRLCGTVRSNEGSVIMRRCFSGICFDENVAESKDCREALSAAALKHRVLCGELLTEVAAYSNKRKIASKHAEDSCGKLYLWALLKNKQTLIVEARVLTLGPKFMSIYIPKIAMERRIHYDEVDGMISEWLDATSTLVLSLSAGKHSHRRGSHGRCRLLEDVAFIINPCDVQQEHDVLEKGTDQVGLTELAGNNPEPMIVDELGMSDELEPTFFPLTVRILSTINVVLHAIGGDDGPIDIGARLYMTSYLR